MIHKFTVWNYGPFKGKCELDFTAAPSDLVDSRFVEAPSGNVLSKMLVFIGANGSGKTKALQSMSFFRWFVLDSYRSIEPKRQIYQLDQFSFQNNASESITRFECIFETKTDMYKYRLQLNVAKVLHESLAVKPKKGGTKWPYLFRWDNRHNRRLLLKGKYSKFKELLDDRDNCTVMSRLISSGDKLFQEIHQALDGYDNLGLLGRSSQTSVNRILDAAEMYENDNELRIDTLDIMHELGLQMDDISVERSEIVRDDKPIEVPMPFAEYHIDGKKYKLSILSESDGTKAVFVILGKILRTLENGGFLILDELDQDMHPHLLNSLFAMLLDEAYNISDAQIICSTHCMEVINRVHRKQVYIASRDSKTYESTVTRMSSIKGITSRDNIRTKYMSGAYGGIPERYNDNAN